MDGLELPGFDEERAAAAAALAGLPEPGPVAEGSGDHDLARRLGDLLFLLADMGRRLGVDPEDAARAAALRFKDEVRRAEGGAVEVVGG